MKTYPNPRRLTLSDIIEVCSIQDCICPCSISDNRLIYFNILAYANALTENEYSVVHTQ